MVVSGPERKWEYIRFSPSTTVNVILRELRGPDDESLYKVEYDDGVEEDVSINLIFFISFTLRKYRTMPKFGTHINPH